MIEIEGILTKDILKEVYYEGGIFPNLKKKKLLLPFSYCYHALPYSYVERV